MDDLIRRSDLLNKVVRFPNYSENGESVDSYVVFDDDVMSIPAVDAVEVVRCRECKYWGTDWEPRYSNPDNPIHYCGVNDLFPTGDWFCKDGQRREGVTHDKR